MPGGPPMNVLPMVEKEIPAVAPVAPSRTEAPSPEMVPTDMPATPPLLTTVAVLLGCWMMMEPSDAPDQFAVLTVENETAAAAPVAVAETLAPSPLIAPSEMPLAERVLDTPTGPPPVLVLRGACWMLLKLVEVNPAASSAVQETALSAPVALTDADAPVPDRLIAGPPDGPLISPVLVTGASLITPSAPTTGPGPPTSKTPWPMSPTKLIAWNGIPPMPMTDRVLAAPRALMPSEEPSAASPLALMIAPVFEMG